ncbi:hypothetical protein AX16_010732 [Volvariella volvacea WC 439]|nr:hypothetical protein AX16_010732 [Volvariella volvacea WC 439]
MTPPPTMGTLPIELIEHIIDFVGGSHDTQTLDSCALASRQLLPVTRYHKFSSISIACARNIIPLQRFARLLKNSPCIADYVQSFDFYDYDIWWGTEDPRRPYVSLWKIVDTDTGDDHDGTPVGGDMPSILNALKKLKMLCLRAYSPRRYAIFSEPLKQALSSTLRLPTFHTLDLNGFEEIPPILFSSTMIKALHTKRCTIADFPLADVDSGSQITRLGNSWPRGVYIEGLKLIGVMYPRRNLENVLDFLLHPDCPLNLTSLRHLSVQAVDGTESAHVMKIINQCRRSLESFEFNVSKYSWSNSLNYISLSGLINLKHLAIGTTTLSEHFPSLSDEDRLFPAPIIRIASMLETLPGLLQQSNSCRLESLTLSLLSHSKSARIPSIQSNTPLEVAQSIIFRNQAWERLDDVLILIITANQDRHRGASFAEPIVKIYCFKGISVKHLRSRCLKRSYKTGRMKIVVVEG